ncbi:hypothetical protein ES703_114270 [subsurface metagenome]
MEENLIKRLMTSIKCGLCGRHYEADSINILGRQESLWFLSASCVACQTRCLVAVIVREEGLPEVVSDLTSAELTKFRKITVPTADEALDMHNFLKDFSGDFSYIFGQVAKEPGEE